MPALPLLGGQNGCLLCVPGKLRQTVILSWVLLVKGANYHSVVAG